MNEFREQIEECRQTIGPPPRSAKKFNKSDFELKISKTYKFINTVGPSLGDPLLDHPKFFPILQQQGNVVWGRVIFANDDLWETANTQTLPAHIIYSLDPDVDANPKLLGEAIALVNAKNPDVVLRNIVAVLNDGNLRYLRTPLPFTLGEHVLFYLSTIWIAPHQLPRKRLKDRLLLLLAAPDDAETVMLLPAKFWPEGLVEQW